MSQYNSNQWSNNIYFILACIGAAVGLGSIWRFPYMAYRNGGGAFLLSYTIALVIIGVPLCMLELALGRWGEGSIVSAFRKSNRSFTWLGWWILINSLIIVFYYTVVLAWCTQYFVYSFNVAWQADPVAFFSGQALSMSDGPLHLGGLNFPTVIALVFIWILITLILLGGLPWIGRALIITVPLPFILLVIMAARTITLPGAVDGIGYFITPRYDAMLRPSVWAAAVSQTVLALGLAMGQMVAYASRKRDDEGLAKTAVYICISILIISILAGVVTFGMMGFLAHQKGVLIENLKLESISLAFISFPMAISQLPLAPLWGITFFVLLIAIGLDSAFAVIEAILPGAEEMTHSRKRHKLVILLCSIGLIGGLVFAAQGGIYWLDIVDHWMEKYTMPSLIILECILFAWFANLEEIGELIRKSWSIFPSKLWRILLRYIIPSILIFVFGGRIAEEGITSYNEYPMIILMLLGWGVFALIVVMAYIVGRIYNKQKQVSQDEYA